MFTSDGPNWEKLFMDGRLQPGNPECPEHREMVIKFLAFYKDTPSYEAILKLYLEKGLVFDGPKKEEPVVVKVEPEIVKTETVKTKTSTKTFVVPLTPSKNEPAIS